MHSFSHNEGKIIFLKFITIPIVCVCVCVCCEGGERERKRERQRERPTTAYANLTWTCSPCRLPFSTHLLLLINTTGEEEERRQRDGRNFSSPSPGFVLLSSSFVSLIKKKTHTHLPSLSPVYHYSLVHLCSCDPAGEMLEQVLASALSGSLAACGRPSRKYVAVRRWKRQGGLPSATTPSATKAFLQLLAVDH